MFVWWGAGAQGVWGYGEGGDGTGQRLGFQGWYATTCAGVLSSCARYQLAAVGTTVPCLLLAWVQLLASASVESDVVDQTFESRTFKYKVSKQVPLVVESARLYVMCVKIDTMCECCS